MGQSWPLFVYFHSFLITISIQIEKSIDGVLGIQTRGRRMVGQTKPWSYGGHPQFYFVTHLLPFYGHTRIARKADCTHKCNLFISMKRHMAS